MGKVERISFSLPPALLKQFDEVLRAIGYKDRSRALQVAMRNFISEYSWKKEKEEVGVGAVLFTYDHTSHHLQEALTDIQHHYRAVVNSTTHIHLDDRRCLEIVSVRGKNTTVKALARELMHTRGVMQLKLSLIHDLHLSSR